MFVVQYFPELIRDLFEIGKMLSHGQVQAVCVLQLFIICKDLNIGLCLIAVDLDSPHQKNNTY